MPWRAFSLKTQNEGRLYQTNQFVGELALLLELYGMHSVSFVFLLSLEAGKEGALKGIQGWETNAKSL